MNKILLFLFSVFIMGLITGFYYKSTDEILGNKIIGFSVVFFCFYFHAYISLSQMEGQKAKRLYF